MRYRALALGILSATAVFTTALTAYADSWTVLPDASSVSFTGVQTGTAFRGQFRRFDANVVLNPADLSTASIEATISTDSFATGSADRDMDARAMDWFHTSAFPSAVFTSTNIVHVSGNEYVAHGLLTIKDIEQPLDLPFTLDIDGNHAVAQGTISLNRMDFKLGAIGEVSDNAFIGHEVGLTIHIEAEKN